MDKSFLGVPFSIRFAEGSENKIQVAKVGTFFDERYGKIEITKDVLVKFKENFEKKIRKIDLALDYKHENDDIAAAWFEKLELSEDGTELWAQVDWTPLGKKRVQEKEFRYISPEFNMDYKDNETLVKHGPTLLGAGLTNRPVIKGMSPAIALREISNEEIEDMKKAEELQKDLEAANKKLSETEAKVKELEEGAKKDEPKLDESMSAEDMLKKISELSAKILELEAELAKKKAEVELSEKNKTFDKMLSEGKVCEAQRDAFIKNDVVKFSELAKPVKLNEQGHGDDKDTTDDSTEDAVYEKAMKLAEEKKISFKEAVLELKNK